jgi:hypothetical protein
MLAWVFGCAPDQLSWEEIRAARAVLVYQAANKSKPEGYVLVPVELVAAAQEIKEIADQRQGHEFIDFYRSSFANLSAALNDLRQVQS